jgi:type I restriction enzyme S subunit
MSRIDDLIAKYCPNGVEVKEFEKVCKIKTGEAVSKQLIVSNPGEYPVINSGREPLGFIDQWNTENDPIGITSRGAGVGSITWCEGRYYRGNLNYSCTVRNEKAILNRFLFHLLNGMQDKIRSLCTYDGIPALNKGNLDKLEIPVPPIEVQQEIVNILDTFTELEVELEVELEARKKQYAHYRNDLLNPSDKTNIKIKPLGLIADYSDTRIESAVLNSENYVGVDNLLQNRAGKTISNYVPEVGRLTCYEIDDILIGNIRPYLKKIWHSDRKGGTNGDVLVIRIKKGEKNNIHPRYLYQILADDNFFHYAMETSKGAKMPRGDKSMIMKYFYLNHSTAIIFDTRAVVAFKITQKTNYHY